eukprot:GILI01006563.1.p1 GENE.GILI01006563.1~~GILI01006563.1.p1  ORF type:complete len:109 (-),score=27.85 GILI01006563.1:207-533(-)
MVAAPRHVYSAWILNNYNTLVTATVQYKFPNGSLEDTHLSIAPGARGRAEEKHVTEGLATFAATINQISVVEAGGKQSMKKAPFNVHGPVRDYVFTVGKDLSLSEEGR